MRNFFIGALLRPVDCIPNPDVMTLRAASIVEARKLAEAWAARQSDRFGCEVEVVKVARTRREAFRAADLVAAADGQAMMLDLRWFPEHRPVFGAVVPTH